VPPLPAFVADQACRWPPGGRRFRRSSPPFPAFPRPFFSADAEHFAGVLPVATALRPAPLFLSSCLAQLPPPPKAREHPRAAGPARPAIPAGPVGGIVGQYPPVPAGPAAAAKNRDRTPVHPRRRRNVTRPAGSTVTSAAERQASLTGRPRQSRRSCSSRRRHRPGSPVPCEQAPSLPAGTACGHRRRLPTPPSTSVAGSRCRTNPGERLPPFPPAPPAPPISCWAIPRPAGSPSRLPQPCPAPPGSPAGSRGHRDSSNLRRAPVPAVAGTGQPAGPRPLPESAVTALESPPDPPAATVAQQPGPPLPTDLAARPARPTGNHPRHQDPRRPRRWPPTRRPQLAPFTDQSGAQEALRHGGPLTSPNAPLQRPTRPVGPVLPTVPGKPPVPAIPAAPITPRCRRAPPARRSLRRCNRLHRPVAAVADQLAATPRRHLRRPPPKTRRRRRPPIPAVRPSWPAFCRPRPVAHLCRSDPPPRRYRRYGEQHARSLPPAPPSPPAVMAASLRSRGSTRA